MSALSPGQRSTILALDETPVPLGCNEQIAKRLCSPNARRVALVKRVQRKDGWYYSLTDAGRVLKERLS